jgi:hypothetical protein
LLIGAAAELAEPPPQPPKTPETPQNPQILGKEEFDFEFE